MPRPDRQLVAFAGRPDGSIELVDRRVSPEIHYFVRLPGDTSPVSYDVGDVDADPIHWEDALKVSGCVNLTVNAGRVYGGNEDVLDVNHSHNCTVNIADAHPRGNFCTTQKGASTGITVNIERQHGHGKEVDHDYGNNSDQGNGLTKGCALRVAAGEATVRVLRAEMPALHGGSFKVVFPHPKSWFHGIVVWFLNLIQ